MSTSLALTSLEELIKLANPGLVDAVIKQSFAVDKMSLKDMNEFIGK